MASRTEPVEALVQELGKAQALREEVDPWASKLALPAYVKLVPRVPKEAHPRAHVMQGTISYKGGEMSTTHALAIKYILLGTGDFLSLLPVRASSVVVVSQTVGIKVEKGRCRG